MNCAVLVLTCDESQRTRDTGRKEGDVKANAYFSFFV